MKKIFFLFVFMSAFIMYAGPYVALNSAPLPLNPLARNQELSSESPSVLPRLQKEYHFQGQVHSAFSYNGKPHLDHPRHKRYIDKNRPSPKPFSLDGSVGYQMPFQEQGDLTVELGVDHLQAKDKGISLALKLNY